MLPFMSYIYIKKKPFYSQITFCYMPPAQEAIIIWLLHLGLWSNLFLCMRGTFPPPSLYLYLNKYKAFQHCVNPSIFYWIDLAPTSK